MIRSGIEATMKYAWYVESAATSTTPDPPMIVVKKAPVHAGHAVSTPNMAPIPLTRPSRPFVLRVVKALANTARLIPTSQDTVTRRIKVKGDKRSPKCPVR